MGLSICCDIILLNDLDRCTHREGGQRLTVNWCLSSFQSDAVILELCANPKWPVVSVWMIMPGVNDPGLMINDCSVPTGILLLFDVVTSGE